MHRVVFILTVLFCALIGSLQTVAQFTNCSDLLEQALLITGDVCSSLGRNKVCYGNSLLEIVPHEELSDVSFTEAGDQIGISAIRALRLSGMNVDNAEWGIAVMKLQANLPDTLPGQNVTFVLFGDVEIDDIDTPVDESEQEVSFGDIQAFRLKTGINDAGCDEAPDSGVLVQTPEGIANVSFMINETMIELGSTAYIQAEWDNALSINMIEGQATVTAQGESVFVPAGTRDSCSIECRWARVGCTR